MWPLEGERPLRRNLSLLVAGGRRTYRTGASADQAADQRALSAARQATDQETGASPTSDHLRGALALTLYDPCISRSLDSHRRSARVDSGQGDGEYTFALELARRLGIDDRSADAGPGRNRDQPAHGHCMRQ